MSADLSARHLETLNMKLSSGRAESAPTLDSLVQAWYTQSDKDIDDSCKDPRRVSFSASVECRPIPAEGRGRRTPTRGAKVTDHSGRSLYNCEQGTGPSSPPQPEREKIDECIHGASGVRPNKERWADMPSEDDDDWGKVAQSLKDNWKCSMRSASRSRESSLLQRESKSVSATDPFLSVCSLSVFEGHSVAAHSSFHSFASHPCQWLMDGGTKYKVSEPWTPGTGGFDRAMGLAQATVLLAPPVCDAQASQEERWDMAPKSHHEAHTCARNASGMRRVSSVRKCSAVGMHKHTTMYTSTSARDAYIGTHTRVWAFGLKVIVIENHRATSSSISKPRENHYPLNE